MKKIRRPKWYTGLRSIIDATSEQVEEYKQWLNSLPEPEPKFENNRYTFTSRYGEKRYFILENNEWFFDGEKLNDYIRVGYKDDRSSPTFIDPSGGPFLEIGSKFRNHVPVLPEHNLQIIGLKKENDRWKLLVTGSKETKF